MNTPTKKPSGFVIAALAAGATLALAGCQTKTVSTTDAFVTADPNTLAIHSVDRLADQAAGASTSVIVIVAATFTNADRIAQVVAPSHFVLMDQTTNAAYYALSGGNVSVTPWAERAIAPGATADVTLGFRVPITMTNARLTYRP